MILTSFISGFAFVLGAACCAGLIALVAWIAFKRIAEGGA